MRSAAWFRALTIATLCGTLVSAQTPAQLAREADARIRDLQVEADRIAAQTRTLLNELRGLEVQRQIKAAEVTKADAELKQVEGALQQAEARVATLDAARVAETPWVKERLVEIYKRGRIGYLRLLLASDDLKAIGRMTRGVAAATRLERVRLDSHRATIRAERDAIGELEKQRQQVEVARAAALKARQALDLQVALNNRRLDDLDQRRDLAARYIGELQGAQSELQKAMTALPGSAPVLPLAPFRGTLEWPVSGSLLSRFGRSTADRFGTAIVRNGIEIAAGEGTPVRAVHAGTVAYAAPFTGFGTLVIVDHGKGAFTLYGHLSQATVTNGGKVGRGDVVGRAGRSPDGVPATYFELRIDGRPVDPVQWLRSNR